MVLNMRQGRVLLFTENKTLMKMLKKCLWIAEMNECVTECLINILCSGTSSTEKIVLPSAPWELYLMLKDMHI